MRAILFSLASLVALVQCVPTGLNDIYKKMCAGHNYYEADGTTLKYTNHQPWEFMKGYQLGSQIVPTKEDTTCYTTTLKTFGFIDDMVNGGYSWGSEILQGKFSTMSDNTK